MIYNLLLAPWGGFSGEFLVGVCRPVLQILTRFQKKKMSFSTPVFSPISKIHSNFQTWSILACSRLSYSGGGSPVSSRLIFVFALSQFSGPNYLGAWNRLGLIRQKLCHYYQIRAQTKKFVKCISNSRISISFLFIWNWKDKFVYTCTLP